MLLGSLVSSGVLAGQFVRTPLFPGGDEPHYLVIAQSLWRDGDLRIENNHTRGDYQEYFNRTLTPHYLTRGVDRQIYSIHPIGMPVLMTPVYALGGYDLVVCALLLLAAIAMTSAWRLAWAVTGSASAATFAWAVLALGPPWIFNTFAVYPEVPAACAVALAFAWTSGWHAERETHRRAVDVPVQRWWAAGVAIACLPWFSTKYLVMAAVLGFVSLLRAWWPWPADATERRRALVRTLAVGVPNAVSLAGWFLFFKLIWGTWSPTAPYGSQRETRLEYLPSGGPGLLFDQEYGIVAFAPALLMVLPGLWALWRQGGASRRLALEIIAVFAGLLGVVGAFHIWWGGSAIVGRPLVSALPLLVVPVAVALARVRDAATAPGRAAGAALCRHSADGVACLGPGWPAAGGRARRRVAGARVPCAVDAGVDDAAVVPAAAAPAGGSRHVPVGRPGPACGAPDRPWVTARAGCRPAACPRLDGDRRDGWRRCRAWRLGWSHPALPRLRSKSAPRVRLLDDFDAVRRPIAIRYDPLTRVDPASVPELFPIVVHAAGDRREDKATQLFGRRLSLPAGTYGVDLIFPPSTNGQAAPASVDGALAVHAGRVSPALETWSVSVKPPGSWGRTFSLPVDIGFVGFKASAPVTDASPRLRLTPQRIVDASARPQTPAVLGSQAYAGLSVLVHGEDAWPEAHRPLAAWPHDGDADAGIPRRCVEDVRPARGCRARQGHGDVGSDHAELGPRAGRSRAHDHRRARSAAGSAGPIGATAHHDIRRLRARRCRSRQS